MKILKETKRLLNERRLQNIKSKYGMRISDSTWLNVKKEINKTEKIIKRYRIFVVVLLLSIIIFLFI